VRNKEVSAEQGCQIFQYIWYYNSYQNTNQWAPVSILYLKTIVPEVTIEPPARILHALLRNLYHHEFDMTVFILSTLILCHLLRTCWAIEKPNLAYRLA
jgi:hypothetical protein